jgi:hypothetical protein
MVLASQTSRAWRVSGEIELPKVVRLRVKTSPRQRKGGSGTVPDPARLARLPDDELLEAVQRQTFRYFWEGAHPVSGLALDRRNTPEDPRDEKLTMGGSGFAAMAIVVAAERGWVTRDEAIARLHRMMDLLYVARCYHGAVPHFMNGTTGTTIPFSRKDDGGDIVETSLLFMGLICARQYFTRDTPAEQAIRWRVTELWQGVEWNWYTQGQKVLYWHWSPFNGWSINHAIHGWNEALITYVLAASSPRYAIDAEVYHKGWASGPGFRNGKSYYDIELALGMPYGGPLFLSHYSFCALDPRGLKDRYADYWQLTVNHVRINRAHAIANPCKHKGYGANCWGLTASDDFGGYGAHAPDNDNGTITPTAAIGSLPYAPQEVMQTIRHFLTHLGKKIWGRYGFVDAFHEGKGWYAKTYLAIDQGPIVAMLENQRTGLLWKLFMSDPDVQRGLTALGFTSPHLST